MQVTAEDIRREHEAAVAALTREQRRAIDRLARARRMTTFNHRWACENLDCLFQAEAAERNQDMRRAD